jgi:hypothetical protein
VQLTPSGRGKQAAKDAEPELADIDANADPRIANERRRAMRRAQRPIRAQNWRLYDGRLYARLSERSL